MRRHGTGTARLLSNGQQETSWPRCQTGVPFRIVAKQYEVGGKLIVLLAQAVGVSRRHDTARF
jgi:hypothetical protein